MVNTTMEAFNVILFTISRHISFNKSTVKKFLKKQLYELKPISFKCY